MSAVRALEASIVVSLRDRSDVDVMLILLLENSLAAEMSRSTPA
jgi:hypothetical protein